MRPPRQPLRHSRLVPGWDHGIGDVEQRHQRRLESARRFVLGPEVTQRRLVRLERRHPQSIDHPGVISWGHVVIRLAAQRLLRLIGEENVVGQEPPYRLTALPPSSTSR
jgi:hypothetical protein